MTIETNSRMRTAEWMLYAGIFSMLIAAWSWSIIIMDKEAAHYEPPVTIAMGMQ